MVGNGIVDLLNTLHQLAAVLGRGEVQEAAIDATSFGTVTLWRLTGKNGLAKALELGEHITDSLDVGSLHCVAQPLHLVNGRLNNNPVVAHNGASSVTEVSEKLGVSTIDAIECAGFDLFGLVGSLVAGDIWITTVSVCLTA